jgi:hypothetical protein
LHQENLYFLLHTFLPFFFLFLPLAEAKAWPKESFGSFWQKVAKGSQSQDPLLAFTFFTLIQLWNLWL